MDMGLIDRALFLDTQIQFFPRAERALGTVSSGLTLYQVCYGKEMVWSFMTGRSLFPAIPFLISSPPLF